MDYAHGHPYVAVGHGGLTKVGHTRDVKKRVPQLRKEFKAKGDVLAQFHACARIEASRNVERRLIEHCAETLRKHSGWEWFQGGDFAALVICAEAETAKWATFKYIRHTEEEWARIREQGRIRQADADERSRQRKVWLDRRQHLAQFHPRHRAKRVFAAIAAVFGAA